MQWNRLQIFSKILVSEFPHHTQHNTHNTYNLYLSVNELKTQRGHVKVPKKTNINKGIGNKITMWLKMSNAAYEYGGICFHSPLWVRKEIL